MMRSTLLGVALALAATVWLPAADKDQDQFDKCARATDAKKKQRACEEYLKRQPSGAHRAEAISALWSVIEASGEEAGWNGFIAEHAGSPEAKAARDGYLRRFPDGALAAELLWPGMQGAGDDAALCRFAERFPNSAEAKMAVERIRDPRMRARYTVALNLMREVDRQPDIRKVAQLELLVPTAPRLPAWLERASQPVKGRKPDVAWVKPLASLDINDPAACDRHIREHPYDVVAETLYAVAEAAGATVDKPESLPELIRWLPRDKAAMFYSSAWARLHAAGPAMTDEQRLAQFRPWILARTYRLDTFAEHVFLADALEETAVSYLHLKQFDEAAVNLLSAAAVVFPVLSDSTDVTQMLSAATRARQSGAAKALESAGKQVASVKAYAALAEIQQAAKDSKGDSARLKEIIQQAVEKQGKQKAGVGASEVVMAGRDRLRLALLDSPDNWVALDGLSLYPDPAALEQVALMPRFYDYFGDLEAYLKEVRNESVALANRWLADPGADGKKKARALFILGYHTSKADNPALAETANLGDQGMFRDYYSARLGDKDAPARLAEAAAAKRDRVALVLYGEVQGKAPAPTPLLAWLRDDIGTQKYSDGAPLQVFSPVIAAAPDSERMSLVGAMLDSYNPTWNESGVSLYASSLAATLTDAQVADIFKTTNPWGKLALTQALIKRKSHPEYIRRYLAGEFYGAAESLFIRRRAENSLIKDINTAYYGIDQGKLKKAVDQVEANRRTALILGASDGLSVIPAAEAVALVRDRFFAEDDLCLAGAEWLLAHVEEARKAGFAPAQLAASASQKRNAARLLVEARFMTVPDYTAFLKALEEFREESDREALLQLAPKEVREKAASPKPALALSDPTGDQSLTKFVDNLKLRFASLTEAK